MKYRKLGKTGKQVSALGFGAMRLPVIGDDEANIDEPATIEMVRYAIDHGVNYVDTAYSYHGNNSERVLEKALRDGYGEKVILATKSPVWLVERRDDFDRFLDEQLEKLRRPSIEFYLLHCLQKKNWPKICELGVLPWAEKALADGRIAHFGFSFHDSFELFREIVDAFDWSICQIQYNFVNEDVQAGTAGLEYAAARGLGVVVMEPLFGGTLADPPPEIREIWSRAGRSPVDAALQWLWNRPEVSVVLSGMNTLEQVRENVQSACRSGVGSLKQDDLDLVARVREKYQGFSPIPCTGCGYCMPCPQGVDIPVNLRLYNDGLVYKGSTLRLCRNLYRSLPQTERAAACTACGTCEEICPQQIEVSRWMPRVDEEYGQKDEG